MPLLQIRLVILAAIAILGAGTSAFADPQTDLNIAIAEYNSGQCDTAIYHFTQLLQQDGTVRQQGGSTYRSEISPTSKAALHLWRAKAELCRGMLADVVNDADAANALAPDSPLNPDIKAAKDAVQEARQATAVCLVDIRRAESGLQIMRDANEKFTRIAEPLEAEVKAEQAGIASQDAALAGDRARLSPDEYQARSIALHNRQAAFQAKVKVYQTRLQETKFQMLFQVEQSILRARSAITKSRGCANIPNMENWPSLSLPRVDITDEVTAQTNASDRTIDLDRVELMVKLRENRG